MKKNIFFSLTFWFFSCCCWLIANFLATAQDSHRAYTVQFDKPQISFTTLIQTFKQKQPDIENGKFGWLYLSNLAVRYDKADQEGMDKRFKNGGEVWFVPHDVMLGNIDFDETYWLVLRNMHFQGLLKIGSSKNLKVIFKDCVFEKGFKMNATQANFMRFEGCKFLNGFMYQYNTLSEDITFEHCKFSINVLVKDSKKYSVFNRYDIENHLFELLNKTEPFDLNFRHCTFSVPPTSQHLPKYHVNITQSNFKNLRFDSTQIHTNINLSATTIENEFQFEDGLLDGKIIIDAFSINPQNARLQWSILEGHKISVFDAKHQLLNGKSTIRTEKLYNRLIGCYSTFYQVFKSQGNRFYANRAYVEWKNVETNYLRYSFEQETNAQIYFILLMNIFLRDFCSYGTDPLQSIYLSVVVILLFASFYFLFPPPMSPHRLRRKDLIMNWLQLSKEKIILQQHPKLALLVYSTAKGLAYIFFLLLRILDALALSLNVFSTLGFGELPINGAVRYLTILEGFVGWFLLSIFSVCLISQVIQ